ncbi:MAG: OmpA family protein [Treponema sp.]|nr:OmpA family protein [Treponema sp.]
MQFLLAIILLFFNNLCADCEEFEFNHVKGSKYRIISVVDQAVFINKTLSHRAETLNRIAVEVMEVNDGKGVHKAVFQSSERLLYDSLGRQHAASGFHWQREYESEFERDRLGRITIDSKYYMPVVRNVPTFPGRDLKPGDRWRAEAHEVHDFREGFGIEEPYRIPFVANYEFLGEREWKGVSYPAFSVVYHIAYRPSAVRGKIYPTRISGTFTQLVYWDRDVGQEKAYNEEFRLTMEMSNKMIMEFRGTAEAELVEAEVMNKEQLIAEIVEEIERLDLDDVNVRAVEEGISLSLEDIRFYADSDRLLPGEQEKLDIIAAILKRYPDNDIIVSGHAARRGESEYLLNLSQNRANAIAKYFLDTGVRAADRMVIRGYGAERPIADNTTEEGMRRNRRVEITILEN